MSKKVILSAPQSGKAGVFSDQLLTRLMVIFLHRRRFTVKVSSSRGLSVILTLSSFHFSLFSSSPLPVTTVPAAAFFFHANFVFLCSLSYLASECSCSKFIHMKENTFLGHLASVSWSQSHTVQYMHAQTKNYVTPTIGLTVLLEFYFCKHKYGNICIKIYSSNRFIGLCWRMSAACLLDSCWEILYKALSKKSV